MLTCAMSHIKAKSEVEKKYLLDSIHFKNAGQATAKKDGGGFSSTVAALTQPDKVSANSSACRGTNIPNCNLALMAFNKR